MAEYERQWLGTSQQGVGTNEFDVCKTCGCAVFDRKVHDKFHGDDQKVEGSLEIKQD